MDPSSRLRRSILLSLGSAIAYSRRSDIGGEFLLKITTHIETYAMVRPSISARAMENEAVVVVAEVSDGQHRGWGECNPRFGGGPDKVVADIARVSVALAGSADRQQLQAVLPAGAARNALDCAFWDFAAKRLGQPVYRLAGLPEPAPLRTSYTISLGTPREMAQEAQSVCLRPILKLKLGGDGDPARISAVRLAVPKAHLIVDANQSWTAANFEANLAACRTAGIVYIEQPLPAGNDELLRGHRHPGVTICADESVRDASSLPALLGKYDAINIKLDKAGGLTEALHMVGLAREAGLKIMVGCTVGTSLAIAPAMLLAQGSEIADLDGPLFLAKDRVNCLRYDHSMVYPPQPALWG